MDYREMTVVFPGGKKVNAEYEGFTIETDQSKKGGGDASAPPPFSLFLSSIGTCIGIYVLSFLQTRDIPTENLKLDVRIGRDPESHRLEVFETTIRLPKEFPPKYEKAISRAAELCAVKKVIADPPEFKIRTVIEE